MIHERKDFGQHPDLTHPAVNYPYGGPAPQAVGAVYTIIFAETELSIFNFGL